MTGPRRLTLFISTLRGGGAERSVTVLAEAFAAAGHDVSVVTWNDAEPDSYRLPESVGRVRVSLGGGASVRWFDVVGNLRRLRAIHKAIAATRPDAVISFLDGTNELFLLASLGARYGKLISCQVDLCRHRHYNRRWALLRRWLYPLADRVVFLDRAQARWAEAHFSGWRCDGIANPLPTIETRPDAAAEAVLAQAAGFPRKLVAMGRLVPQKGFDMLLDAFAPLAGMHPDWALIILGEGPDRANLEAQRERLGLTARVVMPGFVARPHAVIAACDLFVFSSRYEGQGLALLEALACGTPAVSFDCPSGPSLVLRDGETGLLVAEGDVAALGAAMARLMRDDTERRRMAARAARSTDDYAPARILCEWVGLIDSIVPRCSG